MKKYFSGLRKYPGVILTCSYFFNCVNGFSQIVVSPGGSPSTIVQSFVGAGLTVSNIQLNCGADTAHAAYGTFSNGSLGLGLSQGIVLSTGSADNLIGPNLPGDSATTGSGSHYGYQDPQLVAIAGDTISDLCLLELDVVPNCSSLQIKFVFGSEEYPEYVNAYNDAFGFFVTGPDGNCSPGFYNNTNVARLPDGTPISVSNVNNGFSLGCPAVLPGPCQNCSYYVNNCYGSWVEYDGFTTVITVNLAVCPCATYHWKFAIADSRDALYDSGIMIETFTCQNSLHLAGVTTSQGGCTCAATATINIASGTPPFTFLWSTGDTTQTITGLCAGNYSVQVTDANSCTPVIRNNIIIQALAITINTTDVTCHAASNGTATAYASGGSPPYSYVWNTLPPQTTQVATGLPPGLWQVTVTDSMGCTTSAFKSILEPDTFFIHLQDPAYTTCQFNDGSLIPEYIGGTAPLSYLWNTTPPVMSPFVFGLAPGVYTVTATDLNGCTATASSTVLPPDHIYIVGDTVICAGYNTLIELHSASTYIWSPADGLYTTTGNSQYVHPNVTTTYMIVGSCPSGVLDTAYFTITVIESPEVTVSPPPYVCYGNDVTLQASGAQRYSWQPDYLILSYSPDSSSITAHPTDSVNFVVNGYNTLGCAGTAVIAVNVQADNQVTIQSTGPTIFCEGDETSLYVSEQGSYLWSTGETTQSITVAEGGSYSVTVTDVNGCTSTSFPVLVVVYPAPVPVIVSSGPTDFCHGDIISLDLDASQADHYLWSTFATTQNIHINSPGTYTVMVTDNRNCTGTASININMHNPAVAIHIFSGPALCEGSPAALSAAASPGVNFLWSDGSTNSSMVVYTDGTYSVTVTDAYSCSATASATLNFNPPPIAVITPAGPLTICTVSPETLQANSGPGYSYKWFRNSQLLNGEANRELIVTDAGSYYVRVTDSLGCFALSSHVEVITGAGPEVSISTSPGIGCRDNVIYLGYGAQSITLTASASGAVSYLWSTGETTQNILVTAAGTYSVTAFDAAGCPSLQSGQSQIDITQLDIRCGYNLQKVILCHVPEGNPENPQTICIAAAAIPAHLALHQYDCLGPCPESAKKSSYSYEHEAIIYPNPATNEFTIYNLQFTIEKVEVFDVFGQLIINEQPTDGNSPVTVDISALLNGIYFVRISSGQGSHTQKFVKN